MKAHDFNSVPQSLIKTDFFFLLVCGCMCVCVSVHVHMFLHIWSMKPIGQEKLEMKTRESKTERRKEEKMEASL